MSYTTPKKICLLIDDDEDDQEIFRLCAQNLTPPINIVASNNCLEAQSLLEGTDFTPAFIFIDIYMPFMDGVECLRYIKSTQRLQDSKVFMLSTSPDHLTAECLELGAVEVITKTATVRELTEKLQEIFEKR